MISESLTRRVPFTLPSMKMLADIVVFEDDYLNVPEEELKNVRVHMTMSGGEVVYQRS